MEAAGEEVVVGVVDVVGVVGLVGVEAVDVLKAGHGEAAGHDVAVEHGEAEVAETLVVHLQHTLLHKYNVTEKINITRMSCLNKNNPALIDCFSL